MTKSERLTDSVTLWQGDALACLREMPAESVQCCVTSPPYYGLRDYGTAIWDGGDPDCDHKQWRNTNRTRPKTKNGQEHANVARWQSCGKCGAIRIDDQIGLEDTPEEFVTKLVAVFAEVRRVLRQDGTLWLNMGDTYANDAKGPNGEPGKYLDGRANHASVAKSWRGNGLKKKDLIGVPWMLAFALRADGWYLRQHMPWVKRNGMPSSVMDRPGSSVESVFLLTKSANYFYDYDAVLRTMAPASGPRLAQDVESQAGSERANGGAKTNGRMKAVRGDKHRGHSRQHAGFNDRWDAMDREEQCGSRGFRNSDLFFSSLEAPHGTVGDEEEIIAFDTPTQPFRDAHFAVFPPKLIDPCIKAGTSAKGCCASCGSPWLRITERTKLKRERPNDLTKRTGEDGTGNHCGNTVAGVEVKTLGWEPSCDCEVREAVPCTVLDPFNGAATTGVVALQNHQNYVGIELNPDYLAISRKRLLDVSGMGPGSLFASLAETA